SPWSPMHTDYGFAPEDSTVTVIALDAPKMVIDFHSDGRGILLSIADMASPLTNVGPGHKDGDIVVLLGPEHRSVLAAEGWTKEQIRNFLFEHMGRSVGDFRRAGKDWYEGKKDDEFIPLLKSPDYIRIVAAGGGAGRLSAVCDGSVAEKFCKAQMRKISL
ncbi:MAG TPA: hypothetical protein GX699_12360, partial [Firmicutes bacterium]|nr:hypothetical protein [Bacillota bacterium]